MSEQLLCTFAEPIKCSEERLDEIFKSQTTSDVLREFEIVFSNKEQERLSQEMYNFDLWRPKKTPVSIATINSKNTLPIQDYQYLVARGIQESGGNLYEISEIIKPISSRLRSNYEPTKYQTN